MQEGAQKRAQNAESSLIQGGIKEFSPIKSRLKLKDLHQEIIYGLID